MGDPAIPWSRFSGTTVLVTGATGTIGSAIARVLSSANASRDLGLTLVLSGRDMSKGRRLAAAPGRTLPRRRCARALPPETSGLTGPNFIFHAAGVTSSAKKWSPSPRSAPDGGGGTAGSSTSRWRCGGAGVCLSSMEVYGQGLAGVVTERDMGLLDRGDPRSSYPEGKRRAEALSVAYAQSHGLHATSARLALTFGAGVPNDPDSTRVPLQFARSALAGRDIELHTDGAGLTNVCYLADAVRALLLLATRGAAGEAYNVANQEAAMAVRQMADVVAEDVAGGTIKVVVRPPDDIERRGYAPPSSYRLATDKIRALGWEPRCGMAEMYRG